MSSPEAVPVDAAALHARLLTLDLHQDLPQFLLLPEFDFFQRNDFTPDTNQVDLPRLRAGGLKAAFAIVYVPQRALSPDGYAWAARTAEAMLGAIEELPRRAPADVALVDTAAAARAAVAAGRLALFVGLENGYSLGEDRAALARFRARGARYLGLCHFAHNQLCDSSTDDGPPRHGGLSALGREAVAECNRLGLVVDVSHASDATAWQCLALSRTPLFASHSNARALCDHPRNLPDDLIRAIAARGGVIGLTLANSYVRPVPEECAHHREQRAAAAQWRATPLPDVPTLAAMVRAWSAVHETHPPPLARLADALDHFDRLVAVAGPDHVALGTDFCGGGVLADVRSAADLGTLTRELVRRGHAEDTLAGFWGENALRVLAAAEAAAAPPE